MGIGVNHVGRWTISSAKRSLPQSLHKEFDNFVENVYNGDFDDFEETVLKAFTDHMVRGVPAPSFSQSQARSQGLDRIYFVVPFAKKDDFKRVNKGLWDAERKCWFVYLSHWAKIEGDPYYELLANEFQAVARVDSDFRIRKGFSATLTKKYFPDAEKGVVSL